MTNRLYSSLDESPGSGHGPRTDSHGEATSNWALQTMALLDEVIEASGGLPRWNASNRITLQLSIEGGLLSRVNPSVRFKEIAAQGCLHNPLVRLIGFTGLGQSGVYRPDCVTIEDPTVMSSGLGVTRTARFCITPRMRSLTNSMPCS